MPELPEVETIKRGLASLILKKDIKKITILCEKSFIGDPRQAENRQVNGLARRGKALLIELQGDLWLMVHLRMTGQLIYIGKEKFAAGHPDASFTSKMPGHHTRVIFEFNDGSHLYFNDQRKFGFVKVSTTPELSTDQFLTKLAPEPWDITPEKFFERLQRRKNTTIKAAILDQTIIAGVGNIYADESLFYAKIFPGKKVSEVSFAKAKKLLEGIREVMEKSIASGGSTLKDYVQADGTKGDYLDKFAKIFNRTGQKCPICNTTIVKTRIAGRGTHYCPECQKP
jgi:formamidopyrimidine-DNA glycosylase